MSKTLDCEFKCGSILPPCVFDQLWETPFLFPPALALPNEKNITAVRWWKPLKPCFNFYGSKKSENQSSICFWNPTVRSPFLYDAANGLCLSVLDHHLLEGWGDNAKRSIKVVSLRGARRSQEVDVSGTSTSQQATALSLPEARLPRGHTACRLPLKERAFQYLHPQLLRPFCYHRSPRLALPFSAAHILWTSWGRKDPVESNSWVL